MRSLLYGRKALLIDSDFRRAAGVLIGEQPFRSTGHLMEHALPTDRIHMVKLPSPKVGEPASAKPGRLQLTDRQAEILRAVEKYGTHTETARHLGVTRQRVSRVIARCEAKGYRSKSARRRDG